MKTPSTSFERLAGALLLVALGAGYWSMARDRRTRAKRQDDVHLEARAERTAGVVAGSAVRLRGVEVGTVKSVELGGPEEGPLPVHLALVITRDAERWLREDSRARILAPIVGTAAIELVEGTGGPRLPGASLEARLEPSIAEAVGKVVADLHGFEGRVSSILANVESLSGTMRAVAEDLRDPSKPVGAFVHDEALAAKLRGTVDDVRHLAADLRTTGGALASGTDGVPAAMGHAVRTAKNVQDTTDALRSETPKILARVDGVATELERLVRVLHGSASLAPEAIASSIHVLDEARRTLEATQKSFLIRGNLEPRQGRAGLASPRSGRGEGPP
jgi:ABC-type transporter Mla subunit MlaD